MKTKEEVFEMIRELQDIIINNEGFNFNVSWDKGNPLSILTDYKIEFSIKEENQSNS